MIKSILSIIFLSLFISSSNSLAAPNCYELESKEKIQVKYDQNLKSQFITITSSYGVNTFFCEMKKTTHFCSGDDDGGEFTILKNGQLVITHVRLGEVSKKFKVFKQDDFKISKLKKVACKK